MKADCEETNRPAVLASSTRAEGRLAGFYVTQAYEAMEALCKQQEKEEREALERQPPPELPMWVPPKNPDFPEDPDLVRWVRSRIPGHP